MVERDKLLVQLKSNNNSLKDWWKTLKGFIKPDISGPIPQLCKDGITYEEILTKLIC